MSNIRKNTAALAGRGVGLEISELSLSDNPNNKTANDQDSWPEIAGRYFRPKHTFAHEAVRVLMPGRNWSPKFRDISPAENRARILKEDAAHTAKDSTQDIFTRIAVSVLGGSNE